MKRTGFKPRTEPMARGTSTLKTTKPMNRGAGIARASKPMAARSKTNSRPRPKTGHAALCRGQPCYLRIPGVCTGTAHDPCHSNQERHGKGKGIKAHDIYTVPGCRCCHNELDQGMRYDRAEKFALWDAAYARWAPVRDALLQQNVIIPNKE
jgi:hypothetical protein